MPTLDQLPALIYTALTTGATALGALKLPKQIIEKQTDSLRRYASVAVLLVTAAVAFQQRYHQELSIRHILWSAAAMVAICIAWAGVLAATQFEGRDGAIVWGGFWQDKATTGRPSGRFFKGNVEDYWPQRSLVTARVVRLPTPYGFLRPPTAG